jgi:hypothetical protein
VNHPEPYLNNLMVMANDHIDMSGTLNNPTMASGYTFQRPVRTYQGFKHFGIKFGRFGHLYGTKAFYGHFENPHEHH